MIGWRSDILGSSMVYSTPQLDHSTCRFILIIAAWMTIDDWSLRTPIIGYLHQRSLYTTVDLCKVLCPNSPTAPSSTVTSPCNSRYFQPSSCFRRLRKILREETQKPPIYACSTPHQGNPVSSLPSTSQISNATLERKPRVSKLPLLAIESIAESLIARGQLRSLANFNATLKGVHRDSLPFLWRTVIWDSIGKTPAEQDEY